MSTDDRPTSPAAPITSCRQRWRLRCNKFTYDITTPTSSRVVVALLRLLNAEHKGGARRIWWGMG